MPSGYCASNVNSSFGAKKKSFYKNPLNLPTIHDMLITCLWAFCCFCLCLLTPIFLGDPLSPLSV